MSIIEEIIRRRKEQAGLPYASETESPSLGQDTLQPDTQYLPPTPIPSPAPSISAPLPDVNIDIPPTDMYGQPGLMQAEERSRSMGDVEPDRGGKLKEWLMKKKEEFGAPENKEKRDAITRALLRGITKTAAHGGVEGTSVKADLSQFDRADAEAASNSQKLGDSKSMAKLDSTNKKHFIHGFKWDGQGSHTPTTIRQLKTSKGGVEAVVDLAEKYRRVTKGKYSKGLKALPLSERRKELEQFSSGIKYQLKDVLQLGVLQPADMALLESIVPNASSLPDRVFMQPDALGNILTSMEDVFVSTVLSRMNALGYKPEGWKYNKYSSGSEQTPTVNTESTVVDEETQNMRDELGY